MQNYMKLEVLMGDWQVKTTDLDIKLLVILQS